MSMTRQHFVAVADAINDVGDANRGNADVLLQVAQGLAAQFATFNPNFDRARFIAACFAYQSADQS
jgi:hypothetical protein